MLEKLLVYNRIRHGAAFINDDDRVLDFGCGTGALYNLLKPTNEYVGVDVDLSRVELKVLLHERKPSFVFLKDFMKERTGTFNAIALFSVLEHIDYPDLILKNLITKLRKNGRIIIITPAPKSELILQALSSINFVNGDNVAEHTFYYTRLGIEKLFSRVGLKLVLYKNFQGGFNQLVVGEKV